MTASVRPCSHSPPNLAKTGNQARSGGRRATPRCRSYWNRCGAISARVRCRSRRTHHMKCPRRCPWPPGYGERTQLMLTEDDLFFGLQLSSDGGEPFRQVTNRKASSDSGLGARPCEYVPPYPFWWRLSTSRMAWRVSMGCPALYFVVD